MNAKCVDSTIRIDHTVQANGGGRRLQTLAAPVSDGQSGARKIAVFTRDVTEEMATEARSQTRLREMQHRAVNLISVVSAVADRTLESSHTLLEFSNRFSVRLEALARVNELLTCARGGDDIDLEALVVEELLAHGAVDDDGRGEQVSLHGPCGVTLPADMAEAFGFVVHELATNAIKHGALSSRGGSIALRWEVKHDTHGRTLRFEWRETLARSASQPIAARGFGRELIERAAPAQLGGRVTYQIEGDVVLCRIEAPLRERTLVGPSR
jgi:two-component system CheB/CheR fusion protein